MGEKTVLAKFGSEDLRVCIDGVIEHSGHVFVVVGVDGLDDDVGDVSEKRACEIRRIHTDCP